MTEDVKARIRTAALVFWDFDGVIKDSVRIKTQAFYELFRPHGEDVAQRVQQHHLQHGGLSRYEKIPLYLQWAGIEPSAPRVDQYCEAFARAVEDAVVACEWVPGARSLLEEGSGPDRYVLVTATPQAEIHSIVNRLGILGCFRQIFGAPTKKAAAIRAALSAAGLPGRSALMIGDSREDLRAAQECNVPFLLRRTVDNADTFRDYNGAFITDFA